MNPQSSTRFCLIVGLLTFLQPSGATAVDHAAPLAPTRNAYLMLGDVSTPLATFAMEAWAATIYVRESAKLSLLDYSVFAGKTTRGGFLGAVEDPNGWVIVVIAHGGKDLEGVYFPHIILQGNDVVSQNASDFANGPFAGKTELYWMACGQQQAYWKDQFPGADFQSCPGYTNMAITDAYLLFRNYTDPSAVSSQREIAVSPPLPTLHPSLWSRCTSTDSGGVQVARIGHPKDPWLQMSSPLGDSFGEQTFNFYVTDDQGSGGDLLFGAHVRQGHIENWDHQGYASPTFNIRVGVTTLFQAYENPSSIVPAYYDETGLVQLEIVQPSGVPEHTLFDGASSVLFGINATYLDSCLPTDAQTETAGPSPAFGLRANTPNPFNPATTIHYDLPTSGRVVLGVYDARGRLLRNLVRAEKPAGRHESVWFGDSENGDRLGSGVYLCRLEAGGFVSTRRVVLIR